VAAPVAVVDGAIGTEIAAGFTSVDQ
jgi:hypothetical protein